MFVEPEGITTQEMYLQGLTTSLPVFVQEKIIKATPGLENARLVRPGYAVEYDYLPPQQLTLALQTKAVAGLFCAGQLNGTSGYEEAAAQGLMAGINAALHARGDAPFILRRDQAYIGVLIDDLVTKGVDEPYRMFTSRAEYRLILRHDNAAERLSPLGYELGSADRASSSQWWKRSSASSRNTRSCWRASRCGPARRARICSSLSGPPPWKSRSPREDSCAGPRSRLRICCRCCPRTTASASSSAPSDVVEQLAVQARYEGYIRRQLAEIRRHRATETLPVPDDFDYWPLEGLTYEAKDKLSRLRPATLGQASRVPGVSPADISVLLVHLYRSLRSEPGRRRGRTGAEPLARALAGGRPPAEAPVSGKARAAGH